VLRRGTNAVTLAQVFDADGNIVHSVFIPASL
jgi:hypothetical protein